MGVQGFVTDILQDLMNKGEKYDECIAIGPVVMMKAVVGVTKPAGLPTSVSLNPIMVDGTGMCGACRVTVAGKTKFACVDGPDFNGFDVDFDELMNRQKAYKKQEDVTVTIEEDGHVCFCGGQEDHHHGYMSLKKVAMPEQEPKVRATNFEEVTLGYTAEMAIEEATRCLNCKHKPCVKGCPVMVPIPEFIAHVAKGEFEEAYQVITSENALPGITGRVCPQEKQCESLCVRGNQGRTSCIGRLERFVADYHLQNAKHETPNVTKNGKKVAVVGSGPAGITCAGELAKKRL